MEQNDYVALYRQLFLNELPLIDVRAPVEFKQGAFPQSINLPLMSDEERHLVGICYKNKGQDAAIELGHTLVSGEIQAQRIAAWQTFCKQNPCGYLYCFRGGLRSHTVQAWLQEKGINYPLVPGGYKALRNYLLQIIGQITAMPLTIVSGNTGCGKTRLIVGLSNGIDLEGHAYHRGSSFGRTLRPQSSQIDFENRLAISLLKQLEAGIKHWVIEDEGRTIGSNHIPPELFDSMSKSKVVVIDDPFTVRLNRLHEEYIEAMWQGFQQRDGEELGWQNYSEFLHHGLYAIRKRLGLERFQQLTTLLDQALMIQQQQLDSSEHRRWLVPLLNEYYDPMYTYQLSHKNDRIVFRGDYQQVQEYIQQHTAS